MEAPFPSHQSLARYAVQRLDLKLLEALLERLSRELVRGHARLLALVRWERERRLLLPWDGGERLRPGPPAWGEGLAAVCPYWGMAFGGRGVWMWTL